MVSFSQARQIAEAWVTVITDGSAEIVREAVQAKPYGWIFYYQSTAYLQDPNIAAVLAGNAPFIVDRVNGEVRVLGTGQNFDKRLSDYERTVPPAVLQMRPEIPTW